MQIKLHGKIHSRKRQAIRKELYEKQKGCCYWCSCFLLLWHPRLPLPKGTQASNSYMEIDHIIPRCAGGSNERHNLVGACKKCNVRRSNLYLFSIKHIVILGQESGRQLLSRFNTQLCTSKMNGDRI